MLDLFLHLWQDGTQRQIRCMELKCMEAPKTIPNLGRLNSFKMISPTLKLKALTKVSALNIQRKK